MSNATVAGTSAEESKEEGSSTVDDVIIDSSKTQRRATPKRKRIPDSARLESVIVDLSAKSGLSEDPSCRKSKRFVMDTEAASLVMDYAQEMSGAIVEEACLLARHRGDSKLSINDIKMIFGNSTLIQFSAYQSTMLMRTLLRLVIFQSLPSTVYNSLTT
jgi:transcription initiation factor TFIID subunit TAF12